MSWRLFCLTLETAAPAVHDVVVFIDSCCLAELAFLPREFSPLLTLTELSQQGARIHLKYRPFRPNIS